VTVNLPKRLQLPGFSTTSVLYGYLVSSRKQKAEILIRNTGAANLCKTPIVILEQFLLMLVTNLANT
jgi:hypothetical protein